MSCESRTISSKSNIHFKSICSDSNRNAGGVSAGPAKPHQESDDSIGGKSGTSIMAVQDASSMGGQEGKAEDNMLMLRDKVDIETEGLVRAMVTNGGQLGDSYNI